MQYRGYSSPLSLIYLFICHREISCVAPGIADGALCSIRAVIMTRVYRRNDFFFSSITAHYNNQRPLYSFGIHPLHPVSRVFFSAEIKTNLI